MICILHGYLLEGSGSNLWTRSIVQSLCRSGETVHLFCLENHADRYDFIGDAFLYHADGTVETLFQREVPYEGRCILHKPFIGGILPVYVWDRYEEFADVRPMVELDDAAIEEYLGFNVRALYRIIEGNGIRVLLANHAVLMSVVAQRISEMLSIPFAIMPHGSAIEYAVKKDERFFDLARAAFAKANRIFVIGEEIRHRVASIFPDIDDLNAKMVAIKLGVDTALFATVLRAERSRSIESLYEALGDVPRGKRGGMSSQLIEALSPHMTQEKLMSVIRKNTDYEAKLPDFGVEGRLRTVDWRNDQLMLFVGRLIASKGIQSIVAALPSIFRECPNAKLIVVGHGPLREPMEIFLWALEQGARELALNIAEWGTGLEGSGVEPFKEIKHFFETLEANGGLDQYFDSAKNHVRSERVIFTGYLTHGELRYLFPACDVAIFPSIVAEAGPLVFLEALASGCFPIGTYFGGMAASIDSVSDSVPDNVLDLMKLSDVEDKTITDLIDKVPRALKLGKSHGTALRSVAVEKYDWRYIAERLARELNDLKT